MESLKRILEFCQQHYEKMILTLTLLVLAGAVWFLYDKSQNQQREAQDITASFERRPVKGVVPPNLTRQEGALKLAQKPPALNFSTPHNLFNPVKWQRGPEGPIKLQTGKEVGPEAMKVTRISPLYFIIALERVPAPGTHQIAVTRETAELQRDRGKRVRFASLNAKTEFFKNEFLVLREIKGPPEDPTELIFELGESQERVSVGKETPYKRVDGYEADLNYPPEQKTFLKKRVGEPIRFAGEDYKIIAINPNEIVLLSSLNDRKYTVPLSVSP